MLEICVSDPEKHGTSNVNAYVDYKISTRTDLARFTQHEFFVRRRFRDFQWLREQLCLAYPGAIVPPLPQVDSYLQDDRFSTAFIERRQAGLELFLRRVGGHPALQAAQELQTFLEAKMWELQTAKNASSASAASTSSSWITALFDGTDASLKKIGVRQERPEEERITKLRAFATEYETAVTAAAAAHHANVSTLADAASDLNLLGPAVNLLSQSETELLLPFTHMASSLDAVRLLLERHAQHEGVAGLSAVLSFHAGIAGSLKAVLANRDRALDVFERAQGLVEASKAEVAAFSEVQHSQENEQGQGARPSTLYGSVMSRLDWMMDDPKKGARLEQKARDATAHLDESTQAWEAISSGIHDEVGAFQHTQHVDLGRSLREHAQRQIEFEAAQQEHWRQLLQVFESVPCPTAD